MPRSFLVLLGVGTVMAGTLLASSAHATFVGVDGMRFVVDGQPHYAVGTNFWQGMNLGMADAALGGDRERLKRELDLLQAHGVNNLRIMAASEGPATEPYRMVPPLQTAPGVYDQRVFEGLDFLLAEMHKRDMKAVMVLNNFWHWSGGMAQYVSWAEGSDIPYPPSHPDWTGDWEVYQQYTARFYDNEQAQQAFRDHIETVVTRTNTITGIDYREDPTIFSWQLANEPRRYPAEWIDDTAAFIKSLDENHMVSTGSEGTFASDFVRTHQSSDIDYATAHFWAQNWNHYDPTNPDSGPRSIDNAIAQMLDYLAEQIDLASTELGKPLVMEEFGLARDMGSFDVNAPTTYRDRFFEELFAAIHASALDGGPAAGFNFWAWGGEGRPDDAFPWHGDPPHEQPGWYAVYDTDLTTLALLADYAQRMHAIPEPATAVLLALGGALALTRRRRRV